MPTFSIISYINDFHNSGEDEDKLKKISEEFARNILKLYTGKVDIVKPKEALTEQQKLNFLHLVFHTINSLAKKKQVPTVKESLAAFFGVVSRDFEKLTGQPVDIFSNIPTNNNLTICQDFFSKFQNEKFKEKFKHQDIGLLWFYIALLLKNETLFLKWLNLGGKFENLPLHQQKAAWLMASEKNYIELKKQLNFFIKSEKKQLLTLKRELTNTISTTNLAKLFIQPLSPFQTYLDTTPYENMSTSNKESHLKYTETYFRSKYHWLPPSSSRYPDNAQNKTLLKNGGKAHVGDYLNPMQLLDGQFQPADDKVPTSPGSAILFDKILDYLYARCNYIQSKIIDSKNIKAGSYNGYPCLMVYIDRSTAGIADISDGAMEAWVDLLISFFTGLINYMAYARSIPIELVRRSSFGFITPTAAPAGNSIRINIGIIPSLYTEVIIDSLRRFDQALTQFLANQNTYPIPDNIFFKTTAYKDYVEGSEYNDAIFKCNTLLELLFAKAETSRAGKTTAQNIVRSPFARLKLAADVFNELINSTEAKNNPEIAFVKALQESLSSLAVKNSKLKFTQKDENSIFYCRTFGCLENSNQIDDQAFWDIIRTIIEQFSKLDIKAPFFQECLNKFTLCHKNQRIENVYFYIGTLNELLYIEAIKDRRDHAIGDGYGSDSDTEGEIDNQPIYANKLITQNGMRAILGTLLGIRAYFVQTNPTYKARIYVDAAYYEVAKGIKLLAGLDNLGETLLQVSNVSEANILIYDLNACITNGQQNDANFLAKLKLGQNKILILDCTSSTTTMNQRKLEEIVKEYDRFQAVFFVSSGLKEEQCGNDKNPYGTIRIFAKNKNTRDGFYEKIKTSELPLLSAVSHALRRKYKALGCTPNNASFFKPEAVKQHAMLSSDLPDNNPVLNMA